ncbi:hypothetical protein BpHYR1_034745 [Brachionus plicatilis]|uniref:Uncharacterized protein n=1 Tax=Brachionus plicatilis TaxID=10195 RepID=A0A3M7RS49_BRAPC|nr:hypothetical protein BpHYR1_034745 [Brachionus plicatilis]
MWNIQTGAEINSFCTAARTLTLERIDDKKFLAGLNDGQLYKYDNTLTGPVRCHSGELGSKFNLGVNKF